MKRWVEAVWFWCVCWPLVKEGEEDKALKIRIVPLQLVSSGKVPPDRCVLKDVPRLRQKGISKFSSLPPTFFPLPLPLGCVSATQ